jgi:hypothetical protein
MLLSGRFAVLLLAMVIIKKVTLLILSAYVIAVVKIVKNRIHVVLRDASI